MPLFDDAVLDNAFDELCDRLAASPSLNPAQSDPLFYFVFQPRHMLDVKRRLAGWERRLQTLDFDPVRISLGGILRELVAASGRWNDWLAEEPHGSDLDLDDLAQVNQSVRSVLTQGDAFVNVLALRIAEHNGRCLVLLTETELLHPYFRVHALESGLKGRLPHKTVVLYPGGRAGPKSVKFLGFYPEDPTYRGNIVWAQ